MKNIFVIMPFVKANERDQSSLTKFFQDYIKEPIETDAELKDKVIVKRSANAFLILDEIILDLVNADIVICDLSGNPQANPNVMFELGIRLASSHKPVILIREKSDFNKSMFDIHGLYAEDYSLNDTKSLERFLVSKVKEYELTGVLYSSPVLKVLNHEAAFWMQLPIRKASAFLGGISSSAEAHLKAFARAISLHLQKNSVNDCYVENADQCYKYFDQIAGREDLLNEFSYNITSIPSLDSYLSSVYLLGLVDDEVEKDFRAYAMSYSLYFNKGNSSSFWGSRFEESRAYSIETLILMNLCRLIIRILASRQGGLERTKLIEKFKKDLSHSSLIDR